MAEFHFLRPWWLIMIIPAVALLVLWIKRGSASRSNWEKYCDAHLLEQLLVKSSAKDSLSLPLIVFCGWLLAILALSGPTWSKYSTPLYQKNLARVIALDVSPYMNANDVPPSRLQRAKYKVLDVLKAINEGQTGMVVFSAAPFVVSPLTADSNTIANMVPVLDSSIVPVSGSNIGAALEKSAQLLAQGGFNSGQILLITASPPTAADNKIAAKLAQEGYVTEVLAIGTANGGPIANANGGFVSDDKGNVVLAKLASNKLEQLATSGAGTLVNFTSDDGDVATLLNQLEHRQQSLQPSLSRESKSLWKDQGYWFIWALIILIAVIARKGWWEKLCRE